MIYPIKVPQWVKNIAPGFVWDVPNEENKVFLTFDDGPHPEISPWVKEELEKFNARGTFFCIGDNVTKYPETYSDLKKNHSVGNHTFNHLNGWRTGTNDYILNLEKCSEVMDTNSRLFRPPYGRIRRAQSKLVKENHQIIMWDLLSGDFDKNISPKANAKKLVELVKPGSILVFHDSEKAWNNLRVMLPMVLEGISSKGLIMDKLSEDGPY